MGYLQTYLLWLVAGDELVQFTVRGSNDLQNVTCGAYLVFANCDVNLQGDIMYINVQENTKVFLCY